MTGSGDPVTVTIALAVVLLLGWPTLSILAARGFGIAASGRDCVPTRRVEDATIRDEEPLVAHAAV